MNNPIRNEPKLGHFTKGNLKMTNMHMKRCSTSLATSEMHIKAMIKYHCTLVRMTKRKI